jgi:hypothetical protein
MLLNQVPELELLLAHTGELLFEFGTVPVQVEQLIAVLFFVLCAAKYRGQTGHAGFLLHNTRALDAPVTRRLTANHDNSDAINP